ncbi:unnamed protein product [Trichobilharzia szidati]|nr:unnamed protein product [Trichobilharzia szidati]
MTVTNPTPEISHHKTFHSSPSRTHTHLSVHYNYEANDIPQSFINVNGDIVNKSTEECTLISNPQTLISSLSSSSSMSETAAGGGGGSTAGTSADTVADGGSSGGGGGVSNTSDDSASPIDSVLTASKIQQLQHDITQLEAAIKTNLNEQKELNDRLFEQLAEVPKFQSDAYESSSSLLPFCEESNSSEGEIKRHYAEKLKLLKKQLKALNEQLQTTRYVMNKLELYGIPIGVSPKEYVKQFINSRRKSFMSTASTASPVLKPKTSFPSTSNTGNLPNDNSTASGLISSDDVCRSHQLAKTLPARTSNPNIDSCKLPTRQSNTLPAKCIHETKIFNTDTIFNLAQSSIGSQSLYTPDIKPIQSSQSSMSTTSHTPYKPELSGPIMSTCTATSTAAASSSNSTKTPLTSHPTAPHLFPHLSSNEHVYDDYTTKMPSTPSNTRMLNTVRTGLGSFGRQLFRVGKPRSHSDENIPVKTNSSSNDDNIYRKKGSSRPVGYSLFTPSDKKKNKKISKSRLAVSNLLYPPESSSMLLSENVISSNSQPIRTGSLSSTNGVNPMSVGGYDGVGGRSMISGLSGVGVVCGGGGGGTASKDDTNPDPSSNTGAFSSWSEGGDNTLMRIFECLGVSSNQVFSSSSGQNLISTGNSNNVPGVGSSGSSALSASGLGVLDKSKAGSKSHIIQSDTFSPPHGGISSGGGVGGVGVGGGGAGGVGGVGSGGYVGSCRTDHALSNISANNLALAFAYLYRRQECQFNMLTNQQAQIFQEIRDELSVMRSETLNIQSTLNNLTTELEAIRRDATTKTELQNQKLADASSRIERLDAIAEESRQALPHELAALRNEFHDSLYSVEYQVTTKIRDLSDNITSINNKVSMIEKPHDQSSTHGGSHGTELERVRRKVLHYLTDLCVSFFALVTMLLQVLIRCLNLGAVLTENRKLAVCFSMTMLASCLLVYTSDPIIVWLREDNITDNPDTTIHRRSHYWRSILIAILSFFRSFSRGMS